MNPASLEQVLDVLERHERNAKRVVNMVPSENSMSTLAKLPLLLDVYHRYFFNVAEADDGWQFRGSQDVACLETGFTLELLRDFTRAKYVNPRPLSGLSGMAMVLSALGGAHRAPRAFEGTSRRRDGAIDVDFVAFRYRCDDLLGGRIEGLERAPGG